MDPLQSAIVEHSLVTTVGGVRAQVIGENREMLLPAGTLGTVVLIYSAGGTVEAFEVEFFLGSHSYALATVSVDLLTSAV